MCLVGDHAADLAGFVISQDSPECQAVDCAIGGIAAFVSIRRTDPVLLLFSIAANGLPLKFQNLWDARLLYVAHGGKGNEFFSSCPFS